jgi:hypothetical protein
MPPQDTPFESIEGALEYVGYLLEAAREAQQHVEAEIERTSDLTLIRRRQALQLVQYKLTQLSSHISTSRRLLNDLRKLRQLILEEKETRVRPASA